MAFTLHKIHLRFCFSFQIMLMSLVSLAHQPDLSTSVLSTTKDGKHVLQIISALTAFEGEINYLYSEDSYKTPEEFKELVIKHFNESMSFVVNENDTLQFANPLVILGHETKMVVEVLNMPSAIESFYFKNTMFKDMPHNKMALMMMVDGFPNEQLVLENKNNQTIDMKMENGSWISNVTTTSTASFTSFFTTQYFLLLILVIALGGIAIYLWNNSKRMSKIK